MELQNLIGELAYCYSVKDNAVKSKKCNKNFFFKILRLTSSQKSVMYEHTWTGNNKTKTQEFGCSIENLRVIDSDTIREIICIEGLVKQYYDAPKNRYERGCMESKTILSSGSSYVVFFENGTKKILRGSIDKEYEGVSNYDKHKHLFERPQTEGKIMTIEHLLYDQVVKCKTIIVCQPNEDNTYSHINTYRYTDASVFLAKLENKQAVVKVIETEGFYLIWQ